MPAILVMLALLSLVLIGLGLRDLAAGSDVHHFLAPGDAPDQRRSGRVEHVRRLDRWLRRTRLGALADREILRSGTPIGVSAVFGLADGCFLLVSLLGSAYLPGPIALVLGLAGGYAPFVELRRRRQARHERFIGQLPEIARVLSNASSAGLALRSALTLAAEEVADPAGEELRRAVDALNVGRSLQDALRDLEHRMPSRELAVLTSTLVISSRSGGSVVTALRNIATTLDGRKELRREIRTLLAQSVASSYLVLAIGVGIVVALSVFSPQTLTRMAGAVPGQVALVASTVLFAVGFLLIRRITRIPA